MKKYLIVFSVASVIGLPTHALADCRNAIDAYNDAVSEIDSRLRRYVNCISSSDGSDDCSTEFRRLRSAQSDFESAVSDYQRECD